MFTLILCLVDENKYSRGIIQVEIFEFVLDHWLLKYFPCMLWDLAPKLKSSLQMLLWQFLAACIRQVCPSLFCLLTFAPFCRRSVTVSRWFAEEAMWRAVSPPRIIFIGWILDDKWIKYKFNVLILCKPFYYPLSPVDMAHASMSALFSSKIWTISVLPRLAARWIGVKPPWSIMETEHLRLHNSSTIFVWPLMSKIRN